jgi:hypothetical protein
MIPVVLNYCRLERYLPGGTNPLLAKKDDKNFSGYKNHAIKIRR